MGRFSSERRSGPADRSRHEILGFQTGSALARVSLSTMAVRSQGHIHSFTGRRPQNEDACHVDAPRGLYIVADGMGGHAGGEVASRLAVDTLRGFFERSTRVEIDAEVECGIEETRMDMAFRLAHREVHRQRHGTLADMGTTLVAMLLRGDRALIAHVGDSRIYRLRGGELTQLTRDHSVCAELKAAGVELTAKTRAFSHVITRAIGMDGQADPDIRTVHAVSGDLFLLCTDGLTDCVPDDRIASILGRVDGDLAAVALTAEAYARGSRDNITAVVVRVD